MLCLLSHLTLLPGISFVQKWVTATPSPSLLRHTHLYLTCRPFLFQFFVSLPFCSIPLFLRHFIQFSQTHSSQLQDTNLVQDTNLSPHNHIEDIYFQQPLIYFHSDERDQTNSGQESRNTLIQISINVRCLSKKLSCIMRIHSSWISNCSKLNFKLKIWGDVTSCY